MAFSDIQFTVPEFLSLLGLAQSLYILVYMALRAGSMKAALLPFLYFLVIGFAFFLDFASRNLSPAIDGYAQWQWAAWTMGPPLSVLLIIQIARIGKMPSWPHYWVLLLVPCAWVFAHGMGVFDGQCVWFDKKCAVVRDWLVITGLCAGAVSLLTVWAQRGVMASLPRQKQGAERFWLIMALIFINVQFLGIMLLSLTGLDESLIVLARTVVGLGLVYIAGTGLFRIYPQTVPTTPRGRGRGYGTSAAPVSANAGEDDIASRISLLLDRDKVYQEAAYSRSDLARELNVPESTLSRVISAHFGMSFPQILNARRVDDAKRLLRETEAPINVIAREVGFNSLASFNRVFRNLTGQTPTQYRQGLAV